MAQIPIEAVIKTGSFSPYAYATMPRMSEKAARQFCKEMGWDFEKTADGHTFCGKSLFRSTFVIG